MKIKNSFITQVAGRFFDHNVSRSGAAHAYYLLFALFPTLIFLSNLLARLELDIHSVTSRFAEFVPDEMVALIENYLVYVGENYSPSVMGFSLLFLLWFPFRATGSMMQNIRLAYGIKGAPRPVAFKLRQGIFTLVLFVSVALSLFASTLGKRVLLFILKYVDIRLPIYAITLWHYLRFLLIGVFMLGVVAFLYAIAHDKRPSVSAVLPGAAVTILAWLAVSIGFSFYVENFAKYSIIYGTLGTVIVLMLWLYMISVILIMGAEFNQALLERKKA